MKRILSLLTMLMAVVAMAHAGDVFTFTFNGGKATSEPAGYFSFDPNGKSNFNSKFKDCEYDGVKYSNGLKMEGSTKILFTTTVESIVTIVQSNWSANTIALDGEELAIADAEECTGGRVYTITGVAAGEHNITRVSGESGLFLVKVEYTAEDTTPQLTVAPDAITLNASPLARTRTATFSVMGKNLADGTYNLSVPGFLPDVGDMLGQRKLGGVFTPGLDFAFGFVDDSYLDKAKERGWLLGSDSVATPATTSKTEDVQVKMTLEPFTDLKIDLNMSRTDNRNKSIQYMYGTPPTHSGSFNMTTISIGSAFASIGSADNGYYSRTFQKFQENLDVYQQRVEARYHGIRYPQGTGMSGTFNPENGTVNKYSADVMVPAFLNAYAGGSGLDIFPSLWKMLPNWSINYKGLSNLPWVRDHFKSVNLTHAYKSIYAVGSYHSYSSWIECMGSGGLGFLQNTTSGGYLPGSLFDVSTVSINENFSPLIGINATLSNNMTVKVEYKTSRVLNLSMTSAQLTETGSKDFVIGWGYKINDFRLSDVLRLRKASEKVSAGNKAKGKGKDSGLNGDLDNNDRQGSARGKNSGRQKIAHDLNLRFDFSIRNQSAIKRDLQTNLCEATSGSKAFKTSAQIDYTMSRMVTLSLYYDRQRSAPLLSSSSYPTITQDFGMSMKFSLTR